MTRFLLPLEVVIELVEHAFLHAEPGDTFIRKAPAATIGTLAEAVRALFGADNPISEIGVRHGEKLYETLATQEELRHAEDMGDYWRLRMDRRGLDYSQYFSEGETGSATDDPGDYHSHNTERLNADATQALLRTLPELSQLLNDGRSSQ